LFFSDTNILHSSVATGLVVVRSLVITLLQIYCWVCERKKFENRLRTGRVTVMSLMSPFCGEQCIVVRFLTHGIEMQ